MGGVGEVLAISAKETDSGRHWALSSDWKWENGKWTCQALGQVPLRTMGQTRMQIGDLLKIT